MGLHQNRRRPSHLTADNREIALEAWTWPEHGNEAHMNLIARPGVGKATRKMVRVRLRQYLTAVYPE